MYSIKDLEPRYKFRVTTTTGYTYFWILDGILSKEMKIECEEDAIQLANEYLHKNLENIKEIKLERIECKC